MRSKEGVSASFSLQVVCVWEAVASHVTIRLFFTLFALAFFRLKKFLG